MSKESRSIGGEGAADTTSDSGDLPLCRFVDLALRRAGVLSKCDRMSDLYSHGKMPCLHLSDKMSLLH